MLAELSIRCNRSARRGPSCLPALADGDPSKQRGARHARCGHTDLTRRPQEVGTNTVWCYPLCSFTTGSAESVKYSDDPLPCAQPSHFQPREPHLGRADTSTDIISRQTLTLAQMQGSFWQANNASRCNQLMDRRLGTHTDKPIRFGGSRRI